MAGREVSRSQPQPGASAGPQVCMALSVGQSLPLPLPKPFPQPLPTAVSAQIHAHQPAVLLIRSNAGGDDVCGHDRLWTGGQVGIPAHAIESGKAKAEGRQQKSATAHRCRAFWIFRFFGVARWGVRPVGVRRCSTASSRCAGLRHHSHSIVNPSENLNVFVRRCTK